MTVKIKGSIAIRDCVCFIAGYAAMIAVQFALFHGFMPFGSAEVAGGDSDGFYVAALAAKASVLAGLLLLCMRRPFISVRWAGMLALSAFLLGFAIVAMALRFYTMVPSAEIAPWFALGGACFGCSDAVMLVLWGRAFAFLASERMYPFVLLGNLAGLFGYGIMGVFPRIAAVLSVVFFLMSLAGVMFVERSFAMHGPKGDCEGEVFQDVRHGVASRDFRRVALSLWRPALGLALFCFMAGLMTKVSGQQNVSFAETQVISIIASAACIVILALPVLFLRDPVSIDRMFGLALPLSATGFLLLPVFGSAAPAVVNAFAQCGSMMASMVVWCMTARHARFAPSGAISLYAGVLGLATLAELCGLLAGCSGLSFFSQESTPSTAVALASLYLLSCCSLFVFRSQGNMARFYRNGEDECSPEMSEEKTQGANGFLSDRSKACEELSLRGRLTPKEKEVLLLLSEGRTVKSISEKLIVSENTTKSHVKSIYQKLDVHSRSEILELIDSVCERESTEDDVCG